MKLHTVARKFLFIRHLSCLLYRTKLNEINHNEKLHFENPVARFNGCVYTRAYMNLEYFQSSFSFSFIYIICFLFILNLHNNLSGYEKTGNHCWQIFTMMFTSHMETRLGKLNAKMIRSSRFHIVYYDDRMPGILIEIIAYMMFLVKTDIVIHCFSPGRQIRNFKNFNSAKRGRIISGLKLIVLLL